MSHYLTVKLQQQAVARRQQGLHRQRHVQHVQQNTINFSSNDYLSITTESRVKAAYQVGFNRFPAGSGGSMVVCGYHPAHRDLEREFAEALHVDDALLFSSGYVANLAIIHLLHDMQVSFLIDKGVHASIYDGLRLAKAQYQRYLHHNMPDFAKKIDGSSNQTVVITESIFSMSGQQARLEEMALLTKAKQLGLIVDEAHGFGVIGPNGLGGVMRAQLTQADVPLRMIPFGKAMGGYGAVVAGQGLFIDALLQMRPAVYSTAMSPAYAHGLLEAFRVIREADDRRTKLSHLIQYFREAVNQSPLQWRDSHTPIQQLQLGCPHRAALAAAKLLEHSICCVPMRQPTVTKEETGLRVILNYHHEPEQIDLLFNCLNNL